MRNRIAVLRNRGRIAMRSAVVLMAVLPPLAASATSPATDTLTIRGQEQSLRVHGTRGGPVAVVAAVTAAGSTPPGTSSSAWTTSSG